MEASLWNSDLNQMMDMPGIFHLVEQRNLVSEVVPIEPDFELIADVACVRVSPPGARRRITSRHDVLRRPSWTWLLIRDSYQLTKP